MFYFLFSKHISSLQNKLSYFLKHNSPKLLQIEEIVMSSGVLRALLGFCEITFRKGCQAMSATFMDPHLLRPHTSGQQALAELNAINL